MRRVSRPVCSSKHNVTVPPLAVVPCTTCTSRSSISVGIPTRHFVSACLMPAGKQHLRLDLEPVEILTRDRP
jgi:hypothetical protein